MGGFLVDVSHMHNSLSRLTITPKGVAFLAKHGRFLAAPVKSIRDKSKADVLAKGLVCFQVGWLLVETISRKAVGYPITLLELHVLVHCACAIAMYGLWFHKPMDIRDPILVDSSRWEDLLALMLVRNYGLGSKGYKKGTDCETRLHASDSERLNGAESAYIHVLNGQDKEPKRSASEKAPGVSAAALVDEPSRNSPQAEQCQSSQELKSKNMPDPLFSIKPNADMEVDCNLVSGQYLDCGFGPSPDVVSTTHNSKKISDSGRLEISLTSKDVRRWTLASRALKKHGEALHKPEGSVNYLVPNAPNIFLDRKGVHAGFYAFFCSWASGGLIAALSVCCFYGASHALAWHFPFPSPAERLLWRIASIDVIAGAVTILALIPVAVYLHEHEPRSLITSFWAREPGAVPILYRLLVLVGLLNVPLFFFSRVFIVLECFLSLRRVPIGVYVTVQWAEYIPRFS